MSRTVKIATTLSLLFTAVLILFYYGVVIPSEAAAGSVADRTRGLGSPLALWMNGRLALFFNFRIMGALNWLMMPVLLVSLLRWTRSPTWQRAALLLYLISAVIVGALGFFNYRYAFTLAPLTLVGVLYGLRRLFEARGLGRRESGLVLAGLVALAWVNVTWSYILHMQERATDKQQMEARSLVGPVAVAERDENVLRTGVVPIAEILDQLHVPRDVNVLVNNLPIFYYDTDRRGVYYWCGFDGYFSERGQRPLMEGRSDTQVVGFLVDSLNCPYIFSSEEYTAHNERFAGFLDREAELLYRNARGYTVHRVRSTLGRP